MNRNFVFAVILLTTLSIVNAIPHQLENTTYYQCENYPILTISLEPNPWVSGTPENYTASGQIEKATTKETILLILFAVGGKVIGNFYQQPIPITPAGSITVTANNVLTPELPSTYANIVAISDTIHIKDMYACAITYIGY
jgi:hypothetical protein